MSVIPPEPGSLFVQRGLVGIVVAILARSTVPKILDFWQVCVLVEYGYVIEDFVIFDQISTTVFDVGTK